MLTTVPTGQFPFPFKLSHILQLTLSSRLLSLLLPVVHGSAGCNIVSRTLRLNITFKPSYRLPAASVMSDRVTNQMREVQGRLQMAVP